MQRNILIHKLPQSVQIGNEITEINSSYRAGILLEQIMNDKELSDIEKISEALFLYYGPTGTDGDTDEKIEKILWFYSCGQFGTAEDKKETGGSSQKRIYDFVFDADYIYAAFLSQYRIDLQEAQEMHWWKFMALFRALGADNEICRIMQIRAMEVTSKMSQEQRDHYNRLKRIYQLPDNRTHEEKVQDFSSAFMGAVMKNGR